MKTIAIHGHRGARGYTPENTLAGFQKAIDQGVNGIELDVQVTSDKHIIVYHDPYINPDTTRTPNGFAVRSNRCRIYDMPLKTIQRFDVGHTDPNSAYGSQFPRQISVPGQKIPTLREVFAWLKHTDSSQIVLNIEMKSNPYEPNDSPPPAEFASLLLEEIQQTVTTNPVWVQSFDWRALREIQSQNPKIPTGFLTSQQPCSNTISPAKHELSPWLAGYDPFKFDGCLPKAIKAAGGHYWGPDHRDLSTESAATAQENYLPIYTWTVNIAADVLAMFDLGVDGITSDYPKTVIEALNSITLSGKQRFSHSENITHR